jgi:large subunit ribosomal protein L9
MARTVQVVLTEDLPNVGRSGQLVNVRPGYARNFLIPRGLAAIATKDNVARIEHEKRVALARAAKHRAASEQLAERLKGVVLRITAPVGEENKLYGSVTSRDVEEALLASQKIEIDRRKILMDPIKEIGTHRIPVRIASGVEAELVVDVVPKD